MLLQLERFLKHVFRSSAVIAPTLSCMTSVNFDTCLTQQSCQLPLQDREWNRLAFFVSLGAMRPTIGDAWSTTDRGLNLCVTGQQQRRSFRVCTTAWPMLPLHTRWFNYWTSQYAASRPLTLSSNSSRDSNGGRPHVCVKRQDRAACSRISHRPGKEESTSYCLNLNESAFPWLA